MSLRRFGAPVNIIGISYGYHDSACCLMQDGRLVAAAQEERFSRIKNDRAFPSTSLRCCLDQGGISIADVDCIAYYEDPSQKLGRQIWMGMLPDTSEERRQSLARRLLWSRPEDEIRLITGFQGPIEIADHHLSHAASAFFFSGLHRSAILTVDGVGEWATTTYGIGEGAEIRRFEQVDFPHSLGMFYSAITGYLGFEVNEGEYKVMGLAPYGQPRYADKVGVLIENGSGGAYRLNLDYFAFLKEDRMFSGKLCDLLGEPPRKPESEIRQFHMDVARSAQVVLEEILLNKARYLHSRTDSENLCMAGGVALNVVANSRCLREGPFKRLFVQPAAGDAGGCFGAAAIAYARRNNSSPSRKALDHVYLGPAHSSSEIAHLLQNAGVAYRDYRLKPAAMLE